MQFPFGWLHVWECCANPSYLDVVCLTIRNIFSCNRQTACHGKSSGPFLQSQPKTLWAKYDRDPLDTWSWISLRPARYTNGVVGEAGRKHVQVHEKRRTTNSQLAWVIQAYKYNCRNLMWSPDWRNSANYTLKPWHGRWCLWLCGCIGQRKPRNRTRAAVAAGVSRNARPLLSKEANELMNWMMYDLFEFWNFTNFWKFATFGKIVCKPL